MAFKIRNLSVLVYANGFTQWHYKTTDSLDEVMSPNYFFDAADILYVGDMIMVSRSEHSDRYGAILFVEWISDYRCEVLQMSATPQTGTS